MKTRIDLLKTLTEIAGKKLLDYYLKEQEVKEKSETDFALLADTAIEDYILEEINKSFPSDSILSEEAGEMLKQPDYLWIIDPLDGTANFKAQIPYFCSTIALQHKGELIAGGVFDPIKNIMFFAEKGKGAFMNGERIHVSSTSIMRKFLISYSTSNHKSQEVIEKGSKLFHKFLTECRAIRLQGSSILDLCGVATGTFDGLVKVGASYWDFAAGCLIVQEAGGRATALSGGDWNMNSSDIFVSNGVIHENFLDILKSM